MPETKKSKPQADLDPTGPGDTSPSDLASDLKGARVFDRPDLPNPDGQRPIDEPPRPTPPQLVPPRRLPVGLGESRASELHGHRREVRRPSTSSVAEATKRRPVGGGGRSRIGVGTVLAFAVLGLLAVAVFVLLPRWVGTAGETKISVSTPDPAASALEAAESEGLAPKEAVAEGIPERAVLAEANPAIVESPDPASQRQQAAERLQARRSLEILVQRVEALEERAVDEWGGEDWTAVIAGIELGQDLFKGRNWRGALQAWEEAGADLAAMEARVPAERDSALAQGAEALAAGQPTRAQAAYGLATTLDPESRAASQGLARAQSWNRVQSLLADAQAAEAAGRLGEAAELYARALALDSLSSEARRGRGRTRATLADNAFSRAMSEGFEALEAGRFDAAREHFRRAETLHAGSGAGAEAKRASLRDALGQVASAEKIWRLDRLREEARDFEEQEAWRQAAARYAAVLELDSTIAFGRDGQRRSTARAELAEALDFHLGNAARFSDAGVLNEARSLLGRAENVASPGPRHRERVSRLRALLADYSEPVRAELLSDSETEVVIYKVGRLGRFERRTLELRPGAYTVIGRRQGYRDVRLELVIEPGVNPQPTVVQCNEAI